MPIFTRRHRAPGGGYRLTSPQLITIAESSAEEARLYSNTLRGREHLDLHPELMRRMGLARLEQVRVVLSTGETRVMTVEQQYTGPRGQRVGHMHSLAYAQFGVPVGDVSAYLYTGTGVAVRADISDAEAQTLGDHIEYSATTGSDIANDVLVMGPHGGEIERWTDEQAERCYSQLVALGNSVACWGTRGYTPSGSAQTASNRWHTTMVDFNPSNHPMLSALWSRQFAYGVQFHGYAADGTIEVGGKCGDPARNAVKAALEAALTGMGVTVSLANNDNWDGDSDRNALNRLVPAGYTVQLEQGFDVRTAHWQLIADTMATYIDGLIP
jgi:phage replication-related protein YjqB (UPF0714/DUF867 family)